MQVSRDTGLFPNLILQVPDPSHTVRIACRDPLHRVERLAQVFDTLFEHQHALLKDLRFSSLWMAKLEVAQKRILEDRGVLGADVNKVIRTWSFSKQRYDEASKRAVDAMNDITGQFELDTVSYTHLTLPTKRIV